MIRFHVRGPIPRRVAQEQVAVVSTRTTLFGFHRNLYQSSLDSDCSKTVLLSFLRQRDADAFMHRVQHYQEAGHSMDRLLLSYTLMPMTNDGLGNSKMPLKLEKLPLRDLETLCILHFFDMFVAYGLERSGKDGVGMDIYCYEHITPTYPSRTAIDHYMEDMLRKGTTS